MWEDDGRTVVSGLEPTSVGQIAGEWTRSYLGNFVSSCVFLCVAAMICAASADLRYARSLETRAELTVSSSDRRRGQKRWRTTSWRPRCAKSAYAGWGVSRGRVHILPESF
ncbi:hypothetical protein BD310DRAFT_594629 [Dichomitus squalens]|uniref:Uncharacterized protein n=1 Tax=Dichomitus squalens TaxID=114155 RepID=A0A4Q9PRC3_9APHY|nr:hypothetical protein BD310DRAFT_594629 [Dichomitus squalens]